MNEIIKVNVNESGIQTVNARELHDFLESKQDFSDWIKNRIKKYDFKDGMDFTIILGKSSGGRPSKEYYISLNMAKELSMVENNEKGKEARKYFIKCEEIVKKPVKMDRLNLFAHAVLEADKMIKEQAKQIEEMKPKAEFYDTVSEMKDTTDMSTVAKVLNMGVGRNTIFRILRSKKVVDNNNHPYQHYVNRGWFKLAEHPVTWYDGSSHISYKTVVFQKGLDGIRKIIKEESK